MGWDRLFFSLSTSKGHSIRSAGRRGISPPGRDENSMKITTCQMSLERHPGVHRGPCLLAMQCWRSRIVCWAWKPVKSCSHRQPPTLTSPCQAWKSFQTAAAATIRSLSRLHHFVPAVISDALAISKLYNFIIIMCVSRTTCLLPVTRSIFTERGLFM